MPIKQSAKKYMRVTDRKTAQNKGIRGVYRNAIKKVRESVATNNIDEAQKWLKMAVKGLDKAAQKKIIKKNSASRRKSRLNTLVKNAMQKK